MDRASFELFITHRYGGYAIPIEIQSFVSSVSIGLNIGAVVVVVLREYIVVLFRDDEDEGSQQLRPQ